MTYAAIAQQCADEVWRPIPGEEPYEASTFGRIRSVFDGEPRVLSLTKNEKTGYFQVGLGHSRKAYVHRLVLMAFHGPCPPRMEGRHVIDPDRSNNRPDNLAWGTKKQNMDDARRHGTLAVGDRCGARTHPERLMRGAEMSALMKRVSPKGEKHWNARLTDDDIRAIRESKESRGTLATRYGVHEMTISRYRSRARRGTA